MPNILQSIIDPASAAHLPFKERQQRRIFTSGSLTGGLFCLFFAIVGSSTGMYWLAYLTTFDMIVLFLGIYLTHIGYFNIARHISFNGSMVLFIGANYFYGNVTHTEIYLFAFPAITVFLFDTKKTIFIYCTYLLVGFMFCLYLQKHFTGGFEGDVAKIEKFAYLNYVFAYCLLAIVVYLFKSESIENSQKIELQKQAIEEKNSEITASITYAKRIQDSLLTPLSLFERNFSQYFLFFNPKDIVSGDFYWMHQLSASELIIAVGDCTGHGVPGAFVSSICMSKLNEAVGKSNSPGRILEQVNREIKINLNQSGNENIRDGMDIILCHFNTTTYKLKYSGANRPLWIIKGNKPQAEAFIDVKADKVSIGGFTENNQQFAEQEISLEEGDTIYLFSDGYADQFGGDNGKKMTTKRFREWIIANNSLPIRDIGDKLSADYHSWKGKLEQIDDVTVLAIRI